MQDSKAIGNSKIRNDRKLEILRLIRKNGSVSRTDIFKETNISKPTVTRIIDVLLQEDLIKETGAADTAIGRPPVSISLNPNAYYSIGVNISRNSIQAAVVDFTMTIVTKKAVDIKGVNKSGQIKRIILKIIKDLIEESGCPKDKILGIGVGVPGTVDYSEGIIVDFITHDVKNVHLKEYLENDLGIKVIVDNNANTRTLGEYWYGYGVDNKNILFVICSEGVGSGVILNSMILRPKYFNDGLGHMVVDGSGRQCSCGNQGCVEAYSSTESIEEIAREYIGQGQETELTKLVKNDASKITYKLICEAAEKQDALSVNILDKAAEILSVGLSNFIQIIEPELIILSGNLFDENTSIFNAVEKLTKEKLNASSVNKIVFKNRKVKDGLYEIGAATMIYRAFFHSQTDVMV